MALNVEVSGSGPDLVLLHGWGMNAQVWNDTAAELARHFRVHCVDLPGYGASSTCTPYTLGAIADALSVALPRHASVCGWSLGGQVALAWARRRSGQVERLVLLATTPRFVRGEDWEHGMSATDFSDFADGLARDSRATLRRFFGLQAHADVNERAITRTLRQWLVAAGEYDGKALAAGLQILRDTDLRIELAKIAQPVLILHGGRDAITPLGAGEYLQRALPHATLEIFSGAAHAPFLTRARQVAQRIVEFHAKH